MRWGSKAAAYRWKRAIRQARLRRGRTLPGAAIQELIEEREQQLASDTLLLVSEMMNLPDDASELPEYILTAMIELEDLQRELQFLRGNRPDSDEPIFVGAPLNPLPHLNSGAIALPEPDEPKH